MPILEAGGKRVMVHYDGQLKVIADQIAAAPFHIIESLTEPPEGDMTYDRCRAAWPDKVFWGNINAEVYELPADALRHAVAEKCRRAGRRAVALEISEDLPRTWKDSIPVVLSVLNEQRGVSGECDRDGSGSETKRRYERMKYVMIFHANLNYAYLTPDRYEFVIRKSYELIFDTMRTQFPDVKFVFEASGYTLDEIAKRCPDVLAKIEGGHRRGPLRVHGLALRAPDAAELSRRKTALWSIRFSNETYKRHPRLRAAQLLESRMRLAQLRAGPGRGGGYANLIGDFEAYSRSCDAAGKPLRPEIYEKEQTKEKAFYHFGFKYDLPGTERAIHFPFNEGRRPAAEQAAHVPAHRPHRAVRRAVFHGHEGLHLREVPGADREVLASRIPANRKGR